MIRALAMALLLSGCAVVERYDNEGRLERRSFAVAPVFVIPTRDAPAVRVRAVGAVLGPWQATVGYTDVTVISADRPCAAFMFIDSAREALRYASLAHDINRICEGD